MREAGPDAQFWAAKKRWWRKFAVRRTKLDENRHVEQISKNALLSGFWSQWLWSLKNLDPVASGGQVRSGQI